MVITKKLVANVGMITPNILKAHISVYRTSVDELRAELLKVIEKMFEPWKRVERDVLAEMAKTRGSTWNRRKVILGIFKS